MYFRTVAKKGGATRKYIQLCHNVWDPVARRSKTRVLCHLGPADELDKGALQRLAHSLSRLLDPETALVLQARLSQVPDVEYLGGRLLGGPWLLDQLWKRLGIDTTLKKLLSNHGFDTPVERLLFAMVANRALAPSSKHAMEFWVENVVHVPDLPQVYVHQLYRAMDFLLEASEDLQHDVFFSVANLLNLEVDLVFLDTTSTYFEMEGEDADQVEESGQIELEGLREWGHSKDCRPDLAQVVVAFAVTRDGIPVRCWVFPGSTSDQRIVERVIHDLNGWQLGRVITVLDTGFNSAENRRTLQEAGGHYIIGEKLRQGVKAAKAEASSRAGRFKTLQSGLEAKEVVLHEGSAAERRFVVVRNPEEAERDRVKRQDIVREVERRLSELKQLSGQPHTKAACALRSHPVFGRYVRPTKTGELRLNKTKIAAEAEFDGKYLISTSEQWLKTEAVVDGYKQLWQIERVFRDLKHVVDIRPVFHRKGDRIRAHVLLCWLALVLIRVVERDTEMTWSKIQQALYPLQAGLCQNRTFSFSPTTALTPEQKAIFAKPQLDPPPTMLHLTRREA